MNQDGHKAGCAHRQADTFQINEGRETDDTGIGVEHFEHDDVNQQEKSCRVQHNGEIAQYP